jgi:hypothetical protein
LTTFAILALSIKGIVILLCHPGLFEEELFEDCFRVEKLQHDSPSGEALTFWQRVVGQIGDDFVVGKVLETLH